MIEIINNIPTILSFFLPGYIGLVIFKSLCGIEMRDYEIFAASSAGSYMLTGAIKFIQGAQISFSNPVSLGEFALASIIAVLLACGGVLIFQSNRFRGFLSQKFNYAPINDTWQNLYNYEGTTRVAIKMKNGKCVRGQIVTIGDIHIDPWIELNGFEVLDKNEKIEAVANPIEKHIMINANDIEYAVVIKDVE